MPNINYTEDIRLEEILRKKHEQKLFSIKIPAIAVKVRDLSEDEPLKKTIQHLEDLVEFYNFSIICVQELIVCTSLMGNSMFLKLVKENKSQSSINMVIYFFTLYFYDYINRVYVFNEKLEATIKERPELNTKKIKEFRFSKDYLKIQNKFRNNYVHELKLVAVFHSLLSGEIVFSYKKSNKRVEVFKSEYLLTLIENSFTTITKILFNLIKEVNESLIGNKELKMVKWNWATGVIQKKNGNSLFRRNTNVTTLRIDDD